MKPEEYIAYINKLENDYPVDQWKIDGIHIWPIVRMSVANYLHDYGEETHIAHLKRLYKLSRLWNVVKGLFFYIGASIKDYSHNSSLKDTNVIMLGFSIDRVFYTPEKKWYDFLREPFVEKFNSKGIKSLLLELTPNNNYKTPRSCKSYFTQPIIDLLSIINKLLRKTEDIRLQLSLYDDFAKELEKKYPESHNIIEINNVIKRVNWIKIISKYYEYIIRKTNASMGMVVCYYSDMGMAFNLACYRARIRSVDIQHGIAGEFHPAYGNWDKVPNKGYELLPSIFWCWGDYEKQSIDKWNNQCPDVHKSILGKNLWIEKWKNSSEDFITIYDKVFIQHKGNYKKHILITLQTGYKCSEIIMNTIKNSPDNWKWWVRLHPTMTNAERELFKNYFSSADRIKQKEIDFATEIPLMTLLRHIDVHVTGWSAVVYDALPFGILSIVTDEIGQNIFKKEVKAGLVKTAFSETELLKHIKTAKKNQDIINNDNDIVNAAINELVEEIFRKKSFKKVE